MTSSSSLSSSTTTPTTTKTPSPITTTTSSSSSTTSKSPLGKTNALLTIGAASLGFAIVVGPFLAPAFRKLCVPWMGTPHSVIRNALEKLPTKVPTSQRRLVDLGSGDGRFVIEAALAGYDKAVGVELNPWLVGYSYYQSWRAGVLSKVTFRMVDFFAFDLKPYDVITCFGANGILEPLSVKIKAEAKDSTLIICYRFPIIGKIPTVKDGELYIYVNKDI